MLVRVARPPGLACHWTRRPVFFDKTHGLDDFLRPGIVPIITVPLPLTVAAVKAVRLQNHIEDAALFLVRLQVRSLNPFLVRSD